MEIQGLILAIYLKIIYFAATQYLNEWSMIIKYIWQEGNLKSYLIPNMVITNSLLTLFVGKLPSPLFLGNIYGNFEWFIILNDPKILLNFYRSPLTILSCHIYIYLEPFKKYLLLKISQMYKRNWVTISIFGIYLLIETAVSYGNYLVNYCTRT